MYSNFSFIKEKFPKTFKSLAAAEKNLRVNQSVNEIRYALEDFIKERLGLLGIGDLFERYMSDKNTTKFLTLQEQISLCQNKEALKELNWDREESILPKLDDTIKCKLMNGQTRDLAEYDFLRRYGNSKGHASQPTLLKITYRVSVQALQTFYSILCKIFVEDADAEKKIPPFDENKMPIQGQEHLYEIDGYEAPPSDAPMSKCQVEFFAHFKRSGSQKGVNYALIRQYEKKDVKNIFLLRNVDTVQRTQEEMIDALPPCMVRPVEISTIDNVGSPFYIVAYHFWEKPQPLSNDLLGKIDLQTRMFLCVELARCMADIHSMKIYHRLLSYESVYLCDYSARGKGWHPHLIKFDFAKLAKQKGADLMATVKAQIAQAKRAIEKESIRKYIPDDWELEDWAKVDIYSLGILFCDILSGKINKSYEDMINAMKEIRRNQTISSEFLNLLGLMISRAPMKRPSSTDVVNLLKTEMEAWN